MSASWMRFAVRPSSIAARDAVSAALFAAGVQGVHEDGDWLVTHVELSSDLTELETAIRDADSGAAVHRSEVATVDWSVMWRDRIGAHALGRLTIAPPWLAERFDPDTTIVIEPEMAFGTGEHPTTRGVIRLMQDEIRPRDVVADLGAGSAVLAIAAVKLGAARVAAIEMDHDAIANANVNVLRNDAVGRVTVIEGDATILLPLVAPVRVVLANIVSSVLVDLLPVIRRSFAGDGIAILGGMLMEEREKMLVVLARDGWRIVREDSEDQWWSTTVKREARSEKREPRSEPPPATNERSDDWAEVAEVRSR